jgi:hypothetical protein
LEYNFLSRGALIHQLSIAGMLALELEFTFDTVIFMQYVFFFLFFHFPFKYHSFTNQIWVKSKVAFFSLKKVPYEEMKAFSMHVEKKNTLEKSREGCRLWCPHYRAGNDSSKGTRVGATPLSEKKQQQRRGVQLRARATEPWDTGNPYKPQKVSPKDKGGPQCFI